MTSTPVKSVDALMNFVGTKNLTQTGGTNQTGSFGDLMSKTTSGEKDLSPQRQGETSAVSPKDAATRDMKPSRTDAVKPAEDAEKPADTVGTENVDTKSEQMEVVSEAGEEIVKDIAKELGVSEEEVTRAMEELGLSFYQLFDPTNLTQLVLNVSGEQDTAVLLTDEGLFTKLQDVLQVAGEISDNLVEKLDIQPEEMQKVLEQLQAEQDNVIAAPQEVMEQFQAEQDNMTTALQEVVKEESEENAPKITIEVKVNGESIKLSTDENGNVDKTIGTVSPKTEETTAKPENQKQGSGEMKQKSQGNEHGNALFDAALQDREQAQEVEAPQQAQGFFSEQTQDIMNQIMDYMKIQLKPDMNQLEMQLHPASLGNVQIQITSRGGEVTAQFHVQNETVKEAIESQIMELKESLKDQGVKVEAVQVTVESHGFESNLWQGQGGEQNAASQNGKRTPRRINLNDLDDFFEEEASEEEILNARVMEMNGTTVDYTA